MMEQQRIRNSKSEEGIALLISIFVLLLISVVAIALIVSSGTESALAGNYRSSTGVYNAAIAGLEEVRARLRPQSPISFKNTDPAFLPAGGAPLAACSPIYVINPLGGEPVTPWVPGSTYADAEFNQEFAGICGLPNPSPSTLSIWNRNPLNGLPFPGPLYKWVRINGITEQSLNLDTYPYDTFKDATLVYYDGQHLTDNIGAGQQVLEVTALAVLPNGSQKLLQYLVTPSDLNLSFPAALTMDGPVGTFATSFNSDFYMSGIDRQRGSPYPSPCPANDPAKYAIGAVSNGDANQVLAGIPPYSNGPPAQYHYDQYRGINPTPSIGNIQASLIPAFQSVNSLDGPQGVVQTLAASANQQVNGPASGLPDMGAPDRLVTTIVRGDLNLSGTIDGYGLLIVTGDLTLDGHVSWHGVILVVGQGNLIIPSYGYGQIIGAVLIARTRHSDQSLRSTLGNITFNTTNANYGNRGFWYDSCWIQAVLPTGNYKVLSFHEIAQ